MGIKDINKFLREVFQSKEDVLEGSEEILTLSGTRIAIDSCNWMYTYMTTAYKKEIERASFDIDKGVDHFSVFKILFYDFLEFIELLIKNNITPVFIWDGIHPDEKSNTKKKRADERNDRARRAEELLIQIRSQHPLKRNINDLDQWKKLFVASTRLPYEYFNYFREFLEVSGIPSITAASDAEKMCVELNLKGIVSGIWSRDTDLYALGAITMITGIRPFSFDYIQTGDILQNVEMDQDNFRDFCIACECDFNNRVRGMGPTTLYKLFKKYGSLEEIIKNNPAKDWQSLNLYRCREMLTPDLKQDYDHRFNIDVSKYDELAVPFLSQLEMEELATPFKKLLSKVKTPKNIF